MARNKHFHGAIDLMWTPKIGQMNHPPLPPSAYFVIDFKVR